MTSKPTVELVFSGDESKLAKALDKGSQDVKNFAQDVDKSSDKAVKALGGVDDAGRQIKDVDAKVAVSGDGAAVAKLGDVAKAGDGIKPADAKVSVSGDGEAVIKLKKVDAEGQKIKPVKVPVEVDDGAIGKIKGKIGEAGKESASSFAGAFSGGILGAGLGEIVGTAFEKASENAHIKVDIQNSMGISPKDAADYGARVGNLFAQGVGGSKDQIASAFGALSSDVKDWGQLTRDQQDQVAHNAVKVSTAFHEDVEGPIKAASSMVANKLSPSFEAAFDLITVGYQTLGSRADDSLDTLQEYSGYFHKLGIDGPEALGLLQQGLQAGARDTDYIADAFKEFGILAIDGSQKTTDAFKLMGFKAKETKQIISDLTAGGPPAEAAMEKVIKKLQGMNPADQNTAGLALFGGKWEDTMRNIIKSIDPAKAKMQELGGATDKLSDSAVTNADKFSRHWDSTMGKVGDNLAGLGNSFLDLGDKIENDGVSAVWDFISPFNYFDGAVKEGKKNIDFLAMGITNMSGAANLYGQQVIATAQKMDGQGTPAIRNQINALSDSELKALGATRAIDGAGNAVIRLPNGKVITVNADDRASSTIYSIAGRTYSAVVKLTGVWAGFYGLPNGVVLSGSSARGNAGGGWIDGPGTRTSDSIPRMLSRDEFVVNADDANKGDNPKILEAMNSGLNVAPAGLGYSPPSGSGGTGGSGGVLNVNTRVTFSGNVDSAFATAFMRLVREGQIQIG
jgi:hypothetical protein